MADTKEKRRALISVSDKTGILELAKELSALGWEIISTGGTAKMLTKAGVAVASVESVTNFPEIMDGRIKTLHPNIHAGILADRRVEKHIEEIKRRNISPIDLIVVNLYPFRETVFREGVTLEEAIEQIDIGGPTMLRAAAKNYHSVLVVTSPSQYPELIERLKTGGDNEEYRLHLAREVFALTAIYDSEISRFLETRASGSDAKNFGDYFFLSGKRNYELRYGENPHQDAAFYLATEPLSSGIAAAEYLSGKSLSFNNLLDADSAYRFLLDFKNPTAVVMKHQNPCGAATDEGSILKAYLLARDVDPVSAFGGIVGLNRPVDIDLAKELSATFLEVVLAPDYEATALEFLSKKKKNLRLLKVRFDFDIKNEIDIKKITGGFLVQKSDSLAEDVRGASVVTRRAPSDEEWRALEFAWRCVKFVKSNAIVFSFADRLAGVGAGQMSRVDSVKIAAMKSRVDLKGSVLASDAFFPFPDGVEEGARAGATAVIQPGGSVRDEDVIKAADELGVAMVFTGARHFRH